MSKERIFFPAIESLRAIAVIMVMLAHFIPKEHPYYIPYLWYGVDLFFTISGFLITYILIVQVHQSNGHSSGVIIKNFFVRRILRLFPVYYAFIGFFFLLRNVFSVYIWTNDYNFYFFTYLQNMYFFYQGALNTSFSHLWSLGVEEQFYLVWPFIIIFLPVRYYLQIFIGLVVIALGTNIWFQPEVDAFRVLTIANLHTLGAGATLAFLYYYRQENRLYVWIKDHRMMLFSIVFAGFIVILNVDIENKRLNIFLIETFLMFTTFMAVQLSITGWPKALRFIFDNRFVHHIGKVSYGIYLFHMLVPVVLGVAIAKLPLFSFLIPEAIWIRALLLMGYSYTLAVISYYSFERYFLRMKSNFN